MSLQQFLPLSEATSVIYRVNQWLLPYNCLLSGRCLVPDVYVSIFNHISAILLHSCSLLSWQCRFLRLNVFVIVSYTDTVSVIEYEFDLIRSSRISSLHISRSGLHPPACCIDTGVNIPWLFMVSIGNKIWDNLHVAPSSSMILFYRLLAQKNGWFMST
jgi:hypothetical protein